ncbi:gp53-like domain-containing protein [Azospirillum brasilense]|uniref:Putative tail fiber protein gp53-like C-terminal domain-containing protein n=1 Tax=Azospirillum brasilense TaxID=192 RepID=A0A235H9R0_AZOBR|nr:hypothetical protein [Azospirillum brasilense]OYD82496.1 hypothetical protein CHT98_20055 [Azospirillum brasilense]
MIFDRVEQTTTTTGTGTLSLIAPSDASRRSFLQAAGNGGQAFYCIETLDGAQYEYGYGTVTAGAPDTLTRNVIASSNANALVNFPAGTKRVFSCLPAARSGIGATPLTSTWAANLFGNGWVRLPLGLIVQWGTVVANQPVSNAENVVVFPVAFPSGCYTVVPVNGDMVAQPGVSMGAGTVWQADRFFWRYAGTGVARMNWVAFGI